MLSSEKTIVILKSSRFDPAAYRPLEPASRGIFVRCGKSSVK